ncbi:MAG: chromosome segregation protein SMC [bacterium]|nr:chromosome segregation protein SMC [bacterium]
MYLKSIEVQGFKSFANKMIFEFHDGITAIVGPNGSGKSNVGDAVRWVLGEQSAKQLRGAKMEDVIFSGTEARKPLGYAYVAITLDNSSHDLNIDYDEVKIARRVFRSGESEYLINGHNCRLKDVQELLLDTGIGKEGYSIIGQGQIEKILSGKPEDRRELFDEAAGIVKFKKRKHAAQKNLEIEKQNLYRINDILSEIEKQVGPLEKQAQVAKEFLKYRDELKSLDVNMFLMEHDRIEEDKKTMEEKQAIATNDLKTTKESFDLAKVEYAKLEESLEEFNTKIDGLKSELSENKIKKEQQDSQIKVLNEQIIAAKQNADQLRGRKENIDVDIARKEEELAKIGTDKATVDQELTALQEEQRQMQERMTASNNEIIAMNKQIDDLKAEIFDLLSDNSNVKSKMQRYEAILEQNNLKKIALNQRLLKNKSDEDIYKQKIKNHNIKIVQINEELERQQELKKANDAALLAMNHRLSDLRKEIDEKRQLFHKEKSRLEYLSNLTERYEGYGNSIRKIMEQKTVYKGIHGVVADIIKVKKEYETAVETALGGSIQNIVTDNEQTAKELIGYLKKNRFGRATFLPLTSISNKSHFYNEKALHEPGVIGLASELVETQPMYKQVVENLLGRIVVVDNIDNAILLAKKYQYSLRIVTIEGDLLNPGGSMSGGAYKNSSNLLGRRREIDDIKENITKIETEGTKLNQTLNDMLNERTAIEEKIAENEKAVHQCNLNLNTERLTLNQTRVDLKNVEHDFEDITRENNEIESQGKELKDNLAALNENLAKNDEKSKQNDDLILSVGKAVEEKKKSHQSIINEFSELKIKMSKLEQNMQFASQNVSRVKDDIRRLKEEKSTLDTSIENSEAIVAQRVDGINVIQDMVKSFTVKVEEIETKIVELTAEKEQVTSQHKDFFNKREELSNRINALDKECYRLANALEKLDDALTVYVNYMWEEYEITYSEALSMRTEEDYTSAEIKKAIAGLKSKIKGLGDVNVNAIEDYKNLEERFELLTSQRDDLVKAEEALLKIIEELDTEMRKQFEEKFGQIKNQFDVVFKELFGGGKGTLELVEGEDLLEAGIRISAQPPGKKLQNMMQLSGGEKALTAISLLFAIQNLKPSPFCLLDEIEAALDESNVDRYAKYLKKLTNRTQFIIITHRRGSMEMADRLYGITMQEKGVSTLVSVNLIENELEK